MVAWTGMLSARWSHWLVRFRWAFAGVILLGQGLRGAEPAPAAPATPAGPTPDFTFVVVADPHIAETRMGPGPSGLERWRAMLDAVMARPTRPEFMMVLGDVMLPFDPWTRQPDTSPLTLAAERLPVYVVAGSNDLPRAREAFRKTFPDVFGERDFYAFTRHSCRFVVLCDAAVADHYGHIAAESIRGQPQWAWLESQLKRDDTVSRVFVFGPIPPHPTGADANMYLSLGDQRLLADTVTRNTPEALFFGHCHIRQDFVLGTSPVHVVPSSHWNLMGAPPVFVEVSVYPSSIALQYVSLRPFKPAVPKPSP